MVRLPGIRGRGQSIGEDRPEFVGMLGHLLAHDGPKWHRIIRDRENRRRLRPPALLRGDLSDEVVGSGSRPRLVVLAIRRVTLEARQARA